jgi:hypothetical protein
MKKKGFINSVVSFSSFTWLFQIVLGGVIHAVVSFFTKNKLEKWKEKRDGENV